MLGKFSVFILCNNLGFNYPTLKTSITYKIRQIILGK